MDFHSDDVFTAREQAGVDRIRKEGAFIGVGNGGGGEGLVIDEAVGHVAAENFNPVEVNDSAIVAH